MVVGPLEVLGAEVVVHQPPLDHRLLQHAAVADRVVIDAGRGDRRRAAAYMRWRRRRGHVLGDPGRGRAPHADVAVARGLLGHPFDGIVAVLEPPMRVGKEGRVAALGLEPPAHVLDDLGVAHPHHPSGAAPVLAVRRAGEHHRPGPIAIREVDVGRQAHAVAHGDHEGLRCRGLALRQNHGSGRQRDQHEQQEWSSHALTPSAPGRYCAPPEGILPSRPTSATRDATPLPRGGRRGCGRTDEACRPPEVPRRTP